MSPTPIRILIVDDHELVRVGLRTLLARQADMDVVGEAATGSEAISLALALPVDVVVLDVRLPDVSGVEVCREIRAQRPATRVIMLTSYADEEALFASIMAGASGYLLKDARGQSVADAIRAVHQGQSLLDAKVTEAVLRAVREGKGEESALGDLTDQERRILELIAEGATNREIAERIHLSEKTVKHYVSSILSKLGVENRAAAAAWLIRRQAKKGRWP